MKTLLPNSCNPMGLLLSGAQASLLGAPEVSAGFWWLSGGQSFHGELIHPPVCNQGGARERLLVILTIEHTLNHENIFSLLNFYYLQENQLAIHLHITFNSMLILTQKSIFFFSMNREKSMRERERERNSCLVLQ